MTKNKNRQNVQSSAGSDGRAKQADNTINITDAELLNKQQELKKREDALRHREVVVTQKEQELKAAKEAIAQKEVELNRKAAGLQEQELQAKNSFPELFEKKFREVVEQLNKRENRLTDEWKTLEQEKEKLRQQQLEIQKAIAERDAGYADERKKLDEELFEKRQRAEKEITERREQLMADLEKEIYELRRKKISEIDNEIDKIKKKLKDEKEQITKEKSILENKKEDIDFREIKLDARKKSLDERERNINKEVEAKIEERKQFFQIEKARLNDEIGRLREALETSNALISNFENLKRKLGDEDPAVVLLKLKTYEEEIKGLREELVTRPTQEMQEAFDRVKSELDNITQKYESLSEENKTLKKSLREQAELEMQIKQLEAEKKIYKHRFESVDADNNRLMEELKRLQTAYEREQDREARIKDIEEPRFKERLPRAKSPATIEEKAKYEIEWLELIRRACTDYGLKFPRRILYAFHTALKTSEWSPITVLAGVSGTGKSELPRLYSHFGGINFLNIAVQPNWDSQESMLGFFNSIDNRFDAQPVLRLLAQTQKKDSDDYPGLKDVMTLILLDEMNLAHVELYFAEFLSKLELRRGFKGDDVPTLEVKLGAGIRPYNLPLGRNVLWAGTMNQDETTKSLSDKVLDRGIVINFPRPTRLERRKKLKPLGTQAPLLPRKVWETWWCRKSIFTDEQIMPYKQFIEEMNSHLSKVGRSLGHRVWQSIEYYMSNYPDILDAQRNKDDAQLDKAMKVAFEDQLVQKVMPKLRGIETRGKSKSDCLDKIKNQLVSKYDNIVEDFELACEFGYGQFIWNSANYLKEEDSGESLETAENK